MRACRNVIKVPMMSKAFTAPSSPRRPILRADRADCSLLANCVIFHTALDMTDVLRQLLAEGWQPEQGKDITAADIAQLSPYLTAHISRFGLYATDVLRRRPDDFDPDLPQIDFTDMAEAA
jgi:hypothetical protein